MPKSCIILERIMDAPQGVAAFRLVTLGNNPPFQGPLITLGNDNSFTQQTGSGGLEIT